MSKTKSYLLKIKINVWLTIQIHFQSMRYVIVECQARENIQVTPPPTTTTATYTHTTWPINITLNKPTNILPRSWEHIWYTYKKYPRLYDVTRGHFVTNKNPHFVTTRLFRGLSLWSPDFQIRTNTLSRNSQLLGLCLRQTDKRTQTDRPSNI